MTTATSTTKSFATVHFKNKISANKKLFFITLFLQLFGLPIISLLSFLETKASEETYHAYSDYEFSITLSIFAFIAALLMAIFIVTSNFKHLHNHAFSDMQLALPLNSKQRFFTNYLAGLATYLVPALIAMPLAIIPCIIGKINYPEYYDLAFRYLPKFAVIIIIGMVMFYTFSVFSATYCGTLADTIINIFLINAVIPLSLYCASLSIGEGFTASYMDMPILMSQIMYTSPIGCAIMLIFSSNSSLLVNSPIFAYWVILSCAVIALVILLSYITYKKRKAEQVSSPYAFKIFYHIFMFFLVFCIFNLLNSFISSSMYTEDYTIEERTHYANILPAFITSAVVFFVIEFISNRGIKKFLHSAVRYTCAIIFAFGFRGLAIATHGFGYDTYVPKAYMVDSVSITDYSKLPEIYIDDKELIKKIVELNSDIVNSNNDEKPEPISEFEYSKLAKDAYVTDYNNYDSITINYIKKNGSIISRVYYTSSGTLENIESYVKISDEYIEEVISSLKNALKGDPHHELQISRAANEYRALNLNKEDIDTLCEALEKDMKSIKPEDYYKSTTICTLAPRYMYSTINIKNCFTNTLSFLEKNGLDKDFLSKNPTNLEDCIVELYPNVISAETQHKYQTDETEYIIHDDIEYFGEASTLGSVSNIDIDKCADEIRELLDVSKPYSKKSEVGGVIAVDSKVYYIPIEYKDKVAEIYNKYKLDIIYRINEYGDFYLKYDDYVHETYIDILPGFFRNDIGVYKYNESGEKVYIFKYDEFQYYN